MSEWATHSAELARKSLDRLNDGLEQVGSGQMTPGTLYTVVDTLSEVTQGLIASEDWTVIDLVRRELKKELNQ
jgi:hypothetical protein